MAKTMLNQTVSRPILYAYAQEQIAKTPSKWLGEKKKAIDEFIQKYKLKCEILWNTRFAKIEK